MAVLPFERFEREIFVKNESESTIGCDPYKRDVTTLLEYGIINIDKPSGPSSHQTSAYVKQILKAKKAGHSGTLDPKVTGVLPVAIGRGTRIVQLLLTAGKEYVGVMQIHKDISDEELENVCKEFVGKIMQLPPIKSAVVRQLRERNVYYFEIIERDGRNVLFRAGTQAGTYIRKLCSDIGEKIGGAHMVELRRTQAGPFKEKDSFTLQDVKDALYYYEKEGNEKFIRAVIRPVEEAVAHVPKVWLHDSAIKSVCHGMSLKMPGVSKVHSSIRKGDIVAMMSLKDELIGYGISAGTTEQLLQGTKGVAVKPDAIFMTNSNH